MSVVPEPRNGSYTSPGQHSMNADGSGIGNVAGCPVPCAELRFTRTTESGILFGSWHTLAGALFFPFLLRMLLPIGAESGFFATVFSGRTLSRLKCHTNSCDGANR